MVIFYFYRNHLVFFGLILANLIDFDHIYYRIVGKVGWTVSACGDFGNQCSWNFYPLHNTDFAIIMGCLAFLVFVKNRKIKFIGFLGIGVLIHLTLDLIHLATGIYI